MLAEILGLHPKISFHEFHNISCVVVFSVKEVELKKIQDSSIVSSSKSKFGDRLFVDLRVLYNCEYEIDFFLIC